MLLGLSNDHKALMKKIEEGLHKVHSLAGTNQTQQPISNIPHSEETEMLEPFLKVNLVSPDSPAENAVCYFNAFLLIIYNVIDRI